jgi:hypothetical protein
MYLIGDTSVRILVPSRRRDGGIIEQELRSEWRSKTSDFLQKQFGGATPSEVCGEFQHQDGRTTREEITVYQASCDRKRLAADGTLLDSCLEFAATLCRALAQESIFVGWGSLSYLVEKDCDLQAVPVIRFSSLSELSQVKHLTMGWAGLNVPRQILQILSLDRWTMPPESPEDQEGGWKLVAQLHDSEPRNAWAWEGDRTALRGDTRALRYAGLQENDLVFTKGRDHYIDVFLVTKKGLVGPRDLRCSHGRLNPVTRQLLMRILHREWELLEADLRCKPLGQSFFPRLRELQERVAYELRPQLHAALLKSNSTRGKKRSAAQASGTSASSATSESQAFRQSVLILGRMMFLRFLMQKRWIPGGVEELKRQADALGDEFYSKWLLPLWFDTLNVSEQERSEAINQRYDKQVPYLNGGLFVPRLGERQLKLPASIFQANSKTSFFRLFEDFEFSLNEYDGSDEALKVDPSFFGKALESFNPDADRKKMGVHYTPKPIALALAAEAIVARVAALMNLPIELVGSLLDARQGSRAIKARQAQDLRDVLANLRIIDPAVGSGVLLWATLRVLMDLDRACDGILGNNDGYQPGSHEWAKRSRHFVCNCLYGVDISDEAVELSRLRLWLAVALAEDEPGPLPDLELNITTGDSLLGDVSITNQKTQTQLRLDYDEVNRLTNELELKTGQYFKASTHPAQQLQLRREITDIRRRLLQQDVAGDTALPFNWAIFFPHVFSDPGRNGFDIVIANPPYVRVQAIDKRALAEYRLRYSTISKGNADLSYAFVELALKKLAAPNGGQVAMIQPNFRHHDAADTVRKLVTGNDYDTPTTLRLWVDFDDQQVFPTASNYVALLFAERTTEIQHNEWFEYSTPTKDDWETPESDTSNCWLRPPGRTGQNPTSGEWLTLKPELRGNVEGHRSIAKRRLGDVATIEVGVQTSKDAVFLLEQAGDELAAKLQVASEASEGIVIIESGILRSCVKSGEQRGYWLLFPYGADGQLLSAKNIAEHFPLAWKYLNRHKSKLEGREGGAFKGAGWFRFGRSQGVAACGKAKVLVPAILNGATAILDTSGNLAFTGGGKGSGGCWAVCPKDSTAVTLEEIAELLRSEAAWNHFLAYGSPQKGGWRGVDRGVLESLPILGS